MHSKWSLLLLVAAGLLGVFAKLGSFVDEFLLAPEDHERQLAFVQRWYLWIQATSIPDFPRIVAGKLVRFAAAVLGAKRWSLRRVAIVLLSSWLLTCGALATAYFRFNAPAFDAEALRQPPSSLPHVKTLVMNGNRVLLWLERHGVGISYSVVRARWLGAVIGAAGSYWLYPINLACDTLTIFLTLFALDRMSRTSNVRSYGWLAGAFVTSGVLAFLCVVLAAFGWQSVDAIRSAAANAWGFGNRRWAWPQFFALTTFLPVSICLLSLVVILVARTSMSSVRWFAFLLTKSASARAADQVKLWKAAGWVLDTGAVMLAASATLLTYLRAAR